MIQPHFRSFGTVYCQFLGQNILSMALPYVVHKFGMIRWHIGGKISNFQDFLRFLALFHRNYANLLPMTSLLGGNQESWKKWSRLCSKGIKSRINGENRSSKAFFVWNANRHKLFFRMKNHDSINIYGWDYGACWKFDFFQISVQILRIPVKDGEKS